MILMNMIVIVINEGPRNLYVSLLLLLSSLLLLLLLRLSSLLSLSSSYDRLYYCYMIGYIVIVLLLYVY